MKDLIGAGDRPLWVWTLEQLHRHQLLDVPWLQHPEIPPGAAVPDPHAEQVMHPPAPRELPAGLPRLTDLEPRRANAEDVADVDRFFGQAGDGEILAEGAVRQVGHSQLDPPARRVIAGELRYR